MNRSSETAVQQERSEQKRRSLLPKALVTAVAALAVAGCSVEPPHTNDNQGPGYPITRVETDPATLKSQAERAVRPGLEVLDNVSKKVVLKHNDPNRRSPQVNGDITWNNQTARETHPNLAKATLIWSQKDKTLTGSLVKTHPAVKGKDGTTPGYNEQISSRMVLTDPSLIPADGDVHLDDVQKWLQTPDAWAAVDLESTDNAASYGVRVTRAEILDPTTEVQRVDAPGAPWSAEDPLQSNLGEIQSHLSRMS